MNVMSQWLYANRARQEIVRLDVLTESACVDAAAQARQVLLSTSLTPRVARAGAHAG